MKSLKKILISILVVILILASAALASYPFISNYLMSLNQSSEVSSYNKAMENKSEDEFEKIRKEAQEYNKTLFGSVVLTDPFDPTASNISDTEYDSQLNFGEGTAMATIEIPAISLNLPIYHGTSDEVLQKGAGHLQKTSLPVGGKGTHAVITGHTGLSTASLFTDINLLKEGDLILIHCLDETLAYEVDQIKVVEPTNTEDLRIDPEQDYVTLVTCTPYGINSHRLLVRGTRVPYVEEKVKSIETRVEDSTWMKEYKRAIVIGLAVFIFIVLTYIVVMMIMRRRRKKENKKNLVPKKESSNNEEKEKDS